mmetsp:Transcript_30695/g.72456  ORF Transcript_30695/g.72456 Transcript_30695/m.72456 type:complete len:279 (-) Transcript_30695:86-922(-)
MSTSGSYQSADYGSSHYSGRYGGSEVTAQRMSEDYGLSSEFVTNETDGSLRRPDINITSSGRVLVGENVTNGAGLPQMRGDASLRPNTGYTNQNIGASFGSLQEVAAFLRFVTIVSTVAAIVWEGFAFPLRLIASALIHPAQFVLGAYLGIFCILVLGAELNNDYFKDNFGFLYDPLSRGFVLVMMGGMCLGILNSWWESLLGLAFFFAGGGYIYTYIQYPEYRRWQNYNERMPTASQESKMYWMDSKNSVPTVAWATPQTIATIGQTASEVQSLLGN